MRSQWKTGEHVTLIAPTGGGKTNIVRDLIEIRRLVVVIATKAKDKTLDKYKNFKKRDTWPGNWDDTRILLWKKPLRLGDFTGQQAVIYLCLDDIYRVGAWCVVFDDLGYVVNTLGLKRAVQMCYTQVRSQNATIVANLQRPRAVLMEALGQATYLIMFLTRDKLDVERIAESMGLDRKELIAANAELKSFELLLLEVGKDPIHVQKRPKD